MVELRILGKRALRLPDDFGDAAALMWLGPGYVSLLYLTLIPVLSHISDCSW